MYYNGFVFIHTTSFFFLLMPPISSMVLNVVKKGHRGPHNLNNISNCDLGTKQIGNALSWLLEWTYVIAYQEILK